MHAQAAKAIAEAEDLERRVEQLAETDRVRNLALMDAAVTQNNADRSRLIVAQRGADRTDDPPVTAEEWNAAHDAAQRDEDAHREVSEADVLDDRDQHDQADADRMVDDRIDDTNGRVLETDVEDVRDAATRDSVRPQVTYDRVVPSDESADNADRARRTLAELAARQAYEASQAADKDRDFDVSRDDPFTDADASAEVDE